MDKEKIKQGKAIALGVAAIGAGLVGGFALDDKPPVEIEVEKIVERIVTETIEVEKLVPVEVIKEVEKLVEVDNGNLDLVLDYLEDNFGDEYIVFEDINDIVKNIKMEDSYRHKAVSTFKANFKDYVSVPGGYVLSDADLVKIRDSEIRAIDYEDKEFVVTFEAEVKFENDDGKQTKRFDITYDYALDRDDNEDVEVSVN